MLGDSTRVAFRILPGLPGTGPYPEQYPCRSPHEGLVVEFLRPSGERWVGNFQRYSSFNRVFWHPNGVHVVVIAGGRGYIIDPYTRVMIAQFGDFISAAAADESRRLCFFYDCQYFFAIGPSGRVWESPRAFLDDVANVRIFGDWIVGEAYEVSDQWIPFRVRMDNGEIEFKPRFTTDPFWNFGSGPVPQMPPNAEPGKELGSMSMNLGSPAFTHEGNIPELYTGQDQELSPPLAWSDAPEKTKSFAIIAEDPDTPIGTITHWVLYNIPPEERGLPEGLSGDSSFPNGMLQGRNGMLRRGYMGPNPPWGRHRYIFTLYALDTLLPPAPIMGKGRLLKAMHGHILAQAQILGYYGKKR